MRFSTTQLYDKRKARGKTTTCHWCDIDLAEPTADQIDRRATKDHITPNGDVPRGRATVLACYACNQVRGNMGLMTWVGFMRTYPNFRQMYQQPELNDVKRQFEMAFNGEWMTGKELLESIQPKIIEGHLP